MRDNPCTIDRIASETTTELVIDPAPGHRLAGTLDHRQRPRVTGARHMAKKEVQHHRRRKLRRTTEACMPLVVLSGEHGHCVSQKLSVGWYISNRLACLALLQCPRDPTRCSLDLTTSLGPGTRDRGEHLLERRHPVSGIGREVGARVERLALMIEENTHRPPTVACQRSSGVHVHRVDIGTLFTIDLHADEFLVQDLRDVRILEGFMRHDMAPVTG